MLPLLRHFLLCLPLLWFHHLTAQSFIPGNTYVDSTTYVEYQAGNLPIILSAPHGGYLEPNNIPDRNCSGCSYSRDSYTQELTREMQSIFFQRTGCYPHVIINLLHRRKFDANRSIGDAADGNEVVKQAWFAYHEFLDSAKAQILRTYGRGLFVDMHGHAHDIQRLELGYTLSKTDLAFADSVLNNPTFVEESSINYLATNNLQGLTHAELLRGSQSLGGLLAEQGVDAVPSPLDRFPRSSESYFSGGYNTQRHGSRDGGVIDGIQIECHQDIRFDSQTRDRFADSLSLSLIRYIDLHYFPSFIGNFCRLTSTEPLLSNSSSIRLFPNPSHSSIQFDGVFHELDIRIVNLLGKEMHSSHWSGQPIDIQQLGVGIYWVECSYKGQRISQMILMKKP